MKIISLILIMIGITFSIYMVIVEFYSFRNLYVDSNPYLLEDVALVMLILTIINLIVNVVGFIVNIKQKEAGDAILFIAIVVIYLVNVFITLIGFKNYYLNTLSKFS